MKLKRLLAMLMASVMVAGMSTTAFADEGEGTTPDPEYNPVDPYVINLGVKTGEQSSIGLGDYDAWESSLYASPYIGKMSYPRVDVDALPADKKHLANITTYTTVQELYNMINMNVLNEVEDGQRAGKGAYASIPAYCTDASVGARAGFYYQRKNLEDSTYYPEGVAGRIRSIMWNSFPHITDMNTIEAAINDWLDECGNAHVDVIDLTTEEALHATQLAIWELAGGDDVTVHDVFSTQWYANIYNHEFTADDLAGWVHFASEDALVNPYATMSENTENNVEMLFDYLLDLDPMEPQTVVASELSFTKKDITVVNNGDDTYDITVTATVDVTINEGDELVLSATLGDDAETRKNVQLVDGINEFKYTFDDVAGVNDVTLEINGYQMGEDAYFFTGDERVTTQSMVAFDASSLPVHAETTVKNDRIINFYKTTNKVVIDGKEVVYPLEGIQFDLYYVCSVDEYTENIATYEDPTKVDLTKCDLVTTITTDVTGKASYNVTKAGEEDGIYLAVEKEHAAIKAPLDPFYVVVPMTTANGKGLTYTINLQPKNDVKDGPAIKKDVTEIDQDLDSFDVGEEHTWIIRGGVPVDMADGKEYIISDTLDYRLTYAGNEDVDVKVGLVTDKAGKEAVTLEKGTDYKVYSSESTVTVNGAEERIDMFRVELTEAGMDAVAAAIVEGTTYENYEVRVYFNAIIDEDASVGELIPNQATLDYTNSVNFEFSTKSDKPEVYTCGISIFKHDAKEGTALAGAKFKLAKVVAEGTEGAVQLVTKEGTVWVVYEKFCTEESLSADDKDKVEVVTTDDKGNALIYGLEEGLIDEETKAAVYYLVEIQAPEGYNILSYPVAVEFDRESHLEANRVEVANSNAFTLPSTGGMGTTIFTVSGITLMAAAFVMLVMKKKENE